MINRIIIAYKKYLPCEWAPTDQQSVTLKELCEFAGSKGFGVKTNLEDVLIEAINQKLALNSEAYTHILDVAFLERIKLNYNLKCHIKSCLDSADRNAYRSFLCENSILTDAMLDAFAPVARKVTLDIFTNIYKTDKQYFDVYSAIFSRFCFFAFPIECVRMFFSKKTCTKSDYFSFIQEKYPDICDRSAALAFIDVSEALFADGYHAGCNRILNAIHQSYSNLNNHCDLAVYIPFVETKGYGDIQWKLYSDIILFAEKHLREKIDKTYFRWKKVADQTTAYIKNIVAYNAEFEYAFQGFVFKDCFVIDTEDHRYALLLIFEKNVRDERVVNCPACFTTSIQGNSYPILNVRSWECENPLCPDRSKYNRGKRYSFMSLFRQKKMAEDDNRIPEKSIARWHLDYVQNASKLDVFEMVVRHYSCVNDGILFFSDSALDICDLFLDRSIEVRSYSLPRKDLLKSFKECTFFYRYLQDDERATTTCHSWTDGEAAVIHGDALDALREMKSSVIDGVVTSPPYYNAKSYSQWPNIYCYLYDMYNISKELYRVMKDGAVFLFNIFDYFDNENNIALSAMGNKRMILGAYMIDIFERLGFRVCGNIIWNKGEIQGNRGFNQGNMTPYYQAPLNCWEHIIILSKGTPDKKFDKIRSTVENIRPVIKIIKGKNVLGHDAPYPKEIPELLIRHMTNNDTVLDPFLGSGTTCIVANNYNVKSIGIEKDDTYYTLCQRRITENSSTQLSLY